MLVFPQAARIAHRGDQFAMSVLAQDLVPFLVSLPGTLSADQVRDLVRAAAKPSTWSASDRVLLEPDPTFDFLALSAATSRPRPTHSAGRAAAAPIRRSPAPRPRGSSVSSKLLHLVLTLIGLAVGLPIAMAAIAAVLNSWAHALLTK
jgi:hypothetical protein